MARRQVNIRLNESDLEKIHDTGIPQSDFIRAAVAYYLDNELWAPGAEEDVSDSIRTLSKCIANLESRVVKLENTPQTQPKSIQPITKAPAVRPGGRDYEGTINQIIEDLGEVSKVALLSVDIAKYGTTGTVKNFLDKLRPALKSMVDRGELVELTGDHGAKIWRRASNELIAKGELEE